jgi:hypothetical protein
VKLRLSDDKISHLSHVVFGSMTESGMLTAKAEPGQIRREIKRAVVRVLEIDAEMEDAIRKKIRSYSKPVPEGTSEWDLLYDRFLREALAKKGIQLE